MSIVTARDDVIPVEGTARLPNRAARGICAAFLFALAVILVFVLVTTAVDPWKLMKLNERRDPGPLPRIAMLLDSPATFAERLNRWFDDRVPRPADPGQKPDRLLGLPRLAQGLYRPIGLAFRARHHGCAPSSRTPERARF